MIRNDTNAGQRTRCLRHLMRCENGQALIMGAISVIVLMGFVGLAVDVGNLRYVKKTMQAAADAAALAGALEVTQCAGTPLCSAMVDASSKALVENGFNGATVVTNCSTSSVSGLKLTINNGPCALGSKDPSAGKTDHVEVLLGRTVSTYFGGLVGFGQVPVNVRSEASRAASTNCIFALDPNGANAVTVDVLATVSGRCGVVVESTAPNAFSCNLLAAVNVWRVAVVGGVQSLLCAISTSPITNIAMPSPADPLAGLPKPTVPACGTSISSPFHGSPRALLIAGAATLYPDAAYCGGINILPTANVTFMPGVYSLTSKNGVILLSPGGLQIDTGASVTGTGVTFYNYGPYGAIRFTATSLLGFGTTLTAPVSGTYAGILFFQDPQDTAAATILGTTAWNTDIEGVSYFPKAKVFYALSGLANYNSVVAYDVDFAVLTFGATQATASGFKSDYSSLINGPPFSGGGAVLEQ